MEFLVLLIVLSHQLLLFNIKKRFDLLSIFTLTDIVILMMYFLGVRSDVSLHSQFNNDLLFSSTTIAGILSLYLGLHIQLPFGEREHASRSGKPPAFRLRSEYVLWISVIIFSVCIIAIVYGGLRTSGLSVWDYFTKGRLADYLEVAGDTKQEGAFFFVVVQAIRPVCLFLLCYLMRKKEYLKAAFVYLILLLGILAIFKTRLEVIITLAIPVAYYHYYIRRIKLVLLGLAIPAFFAMLTFLDYWRGVGVEDIDKIEVNVESAKGGLERDINAVRGYQLLWDLEKKQMLDKEYGANYLFMLLTPVPRFLWEDKPILAFEPRWTSKIFGDFTDGIWIFTAWGEGVAQFGILGVIINLFLYGLVINSAYTLIRVKPYMALTWFYYCVLASTYLRGGFQQVFIMTLFYFLPLFISLYFASRNLKWK